MKNTIQEKFWKSDFGKNYTERNIYNPDELDAFYKKTFGVSASDMNEEFLGDLAIGSILEIGSNVGNQLRLLQKQGYENLYGIEIQSYAVERAKELTKGINIIEGSVFDIPFKDSCFDLVFTAGTLIHIHPDDIEKAMREIYRVSKKYIKGFGYYGDDYKEIEYRGHGERLWKGNFAQMYLDLFPDLKLVKQKKCEYQENDNVDELFLLEK